MLFGRYASCKAEARYPTIWNGLYGAWAPAITGPSGKTVYDLSGNGRHGEFASDAAFPGGWTRDRGRICNVMGGLSTRYVVVPGITNAAIVNGFTITIWLRPGATGWFNNYLTLAGFTTGPFDGQMFAIMAMNDAGNQYVSFRRQASNSSTIGGALDPTKPQFYAGVYTRTGAASGSFYLQNNTTVAVANTGFYSLSASRNFSIAYSTTQTLGWVIECSLHNRPLKQQELNLLSDCPGRLFEPRRRPRRDSSAYRRRTQYAQAIGTGVI
jgi:hypothetical protein